MATYLVTRGVAIGWDWADPVIGLLIAAAIRPVLGDAAREVYRQLMEANDSRLVAEAEHCLASTPGATRVGRVRLGWTGHHL